MFLAKSCRIIGVLLKGRLMLYLFPYLFYMVYAGYANAIKKPRDEKTLESCQNAVLGQQC